MLGCSHDVSFGEREGVCTGGVGCGEVRGAEERGAVTQVLLTDMGDTRALLGVFRVLPVTVLQGALFHFCGSSSACTHGKAKMQK